MLRLNRGRLLRTNVVEPSAAHRHWRRAWPRLPPLVGEAGDLPRLQGLKHPPRHGTFAVLRSPHVSPSSHPIKRTQQSNPCSSLPSRSRRITTPSYPTSVSPRMARPAATATSPPGSWARTATLRRSTSPQVHTRAHIMYLTHRPTSPPTFLARNQVHQTFWVSRAPVREERRVRLRRGAAGDADGPAGAGHGPPRAAAQPGGVGQAVPGGPAEAGAPRRPAARGPVPVQGGAAGGPAHAALPRGGPQEPALHGGGRAGTRGDRAAQGAAQGRAAGPPGRSSAEQPRPRAVVAPEVRVRVRPGGEQQPPPPVSEHEVASTAAAGPALIDLTGKFFGGHLPASGRW